MNEKLKNAITLLKKAVKYSHLDNQKHLDLTVINANIRFEYQKALVTIQNAIKNGEKTEAEIKQELGLT
jgi:hypothetical protein